MKKFLLLASCFLAGCVAPSSAGAPGGLLYNEVKDKAYFTTVDNSVSASKEGSSCTRSILGLVTTGDASVKTAMKNGGISKVHSYGRNSKAILFGAYQFNCTVVLGQ